MDVFVMERSAIQKEITQRSRFTRKSPVVAAATVLPDFMFTKTLGPSSSFLLGWIIKVLEPLRRIFFRFTLKMGYQQVYSCHVHFQLRCGFLAVSK